MAPTWAVAVALACALETVAQAPPPIVTDGTLPPVAPGLIPPVSGNRYTIGDNLGVVRGGNRFHSFERFGVPAGKEVLFTSGGPLNNILARVTGGETSMIDGRIRSDVAGADLFLMNPSGIIFGPESSLNVRGDFTATTADYLLLEGEGRFDATEPGKSLLTSAPPSAFGFLEGETGSIRADGAHLSGSPGSALRLVGGELVVAGDPQTGRSGELTAPGGRVVLGAMPAASEAPLDLNPVGAGAELAGGGPVSLLAGAVVEVPLDDPATGAAGQIVIRGGQVLLAEGSLLNASAWGESAAAGGSISVTATESASIMGEILAHAEVEPVDSELPASATGGDVLLTSRGSLDVGGTISAAATGYGAGGSGLTVNGGSVSIHAREWVDLSAEVRTGAEADGTGMAWDELYAEGSGRAAVVAAAGAVTVTAQDSITIRGTVSTDAIAYGDGGAPVTAAAGSVTIEAQGLVDIRGEIVASADADGSAWSWEEPASHGSTVVAGALHPRGAFLATGGTVRVTTQGAVDFSGEIFTDAMGYGGGSPLTVNGGSVSITAAKSVDISGGIDTTAWDYADEFDLGLSRVFHAGPVTIVAGQSVAVSGTIDADASGAATPSASLTVRGGSISLDAQESVAVSGPLWAEASAEQIETEGSPLPVARGEITAAGGVLLVKAAGSLLIEDTGELLVGAYSTAFSGSTVDSQAGSVTLDARGPVEIGGTIMASADADGSAWVWEEPFVHGSTESTDVVHPDGAFLANGGTVRVTTQGAVDFSGEIFTDATGYGGGSPLAVNGGSVSITASRSVDISGGTIDLSRAATGTGGSLEVIGRDIVLDRATIVADTAGGGSPGSLNFEADEIQVTQSVLTFLNSGGGTGTGLRMRADRALISGSPILGGTFGAGSGGQVTLEIQDHLSIGRGTRILTGTTGSGTGGDFVIGVPGVRGDLDVEITGGSLLATTSGTDLAPTGGRSGNIEIWAASVRLADGGELSTEALGTTEVGQPRQAGTLTIKSDRVELVGGRVSTSTWGEADGGNVELDVRDALRLSEGARIASESTGSGRAGDIVLAGAREARLDGSSVSVAAPEATAGDVAIRAETIVANNSRVTAAGMAGGNVILVAGRLGILIDSVVNARSGGGSAGHLTIGRESPPGQHEYLPLVVLKGVTGLAAATAGAGLQGTVKLHTRSVVAWNTTFDVPVLLPFDVNFTSPLATIATAPREQPDWQQDPEWEGVRQGGYTPVGLGSETGLAEPFRLRLDAAP